MREIIIKLEKKKRYVKSFKDSIVVEILEEDYISKDYFLYFDISNIITNDKLINIPIYIPYNEGKELKAQGIIKGINKYELKHSIKNRNDLLGCPIIYESSSFVIGINKKENSGNFIFPIIHILMTHNFSSHMKQYLNS